LDGNSTRSEDAANGIIKLPGAVPEATVFDSVRIAIDQDAMKLAVALHIGAEKEGVVKKAIEEISLANRDPQLLFNQVGQRTGFIPSEIVSSAVVGLMD
jgi:hypothetical protein